MQYRYQGMPSSEVSSDALGPPGGIPTVTSRVTAGSRYAHQRPAPEPRARSKASITATGLRQPAPTARAGRRRDGRMLASVR